MNIQQALIEYENTIELFELEILLSYVIKKSRAFIIAFPEYLLLLSQYRQFKQIVFRRIQGEPIAHILNKKEFWSLEFYVNEHTLIPRPETELLIEIMLENFNTKESWHFLDLGTGSGAIAITLAKLFPHSKITAIDNSENALKVAKKNRKKHSVENISFIQSDWFSALNPDKNHHFDAIVSNPPYLAVDDPHLLKGDVRFEPSLALVGGKNGTEKITEILSSAKPFLKSEDSLVLIEHGYDQANDINKIFNNNEFKCIMQRRDLNNLPRVTMGKLSGIKRKDCAQRAGRSSWLDKC